MLRYIQIGKGSPELVYLIVFLVPSKTALTTDHAISCDCLAPADSTADQSMGAQVIEITTNPLGKAYYLVYTIYICTTNNVFTSINYYIFFF